MKGIKYSELVRDCSDTLEEMSDFAWELFSYDGVDPGKFLFKPSGTFKLSFQLSSDGH